MASNGSVASDEPCSSVASDEPCSSVAYRSPPGEPGGSYTPPTNPVHACCERLMMQRMKDHIVTLPEEMD